VREVILQLPLPHSSRRAEGREGPF
jgi:hypothetical protein